MVTVHPKFQETLILLYIRFAASSRGEPREFCRATLKVRDPSFLQVRLPQPTASKEMPPTPSGSRRSPHTSAPAVSLSQHVRGRHMEEACKVRAEASASENATEKRKAWTHDEVERFKAALIRFGPLSNVAIADAVGTRTNKQVGVFKRAFLTKNPDWISANAPPQTTPPLSRSTALPGLNLADAICCDAGYTLAGGKVNSLAYADDICLVAADKVETQGLLNRCMEFVEWAGLKFNAAKQPGDTGASGDPDEGDILQAPFTPEEVVTQFRRSKHTAPGVDGLNPPAIEKRLLEEGMKASRQGILKFIKRVNCWVPHPWKHSLVKLVHKEGDTNAIGNWSPISLLLTIYKTYSAIIARRIASWAISTSDFSDAQNGFVAFDGYAKHKFLLCTIMTDSRRHRHNLVLTWLDLRDTFGSVPHHLMLSIMKRLSVPVRVGARGPPRLLYALGRNHSHLRFPRTGMFLKHLDTSNAGHTLVGHSINSLAFADNICIIESSKEGIQSLLDRCKEFADWVDLTFNVKKCGSLCLVNEAEQETSSPYRAQSVSV
eukprot:Em0007g1039a